MDVPSLKKSHPQKYYFKALCKFMFYLGMGDLWYEESDASYISRKLYTVWRVIANGYIIIILLDELLSYARTDLTDREKNDLVQFTFAHPLIYCKVLTLYIWKDRIKVVMERLLEGSRLIFHSLELERLSVKQFSRHCFSLTTVSYVTLCSATIEGIRLHFIEGKLLFFFLQIWTKVTFVCFYNAGTTRLLLFQIDKSGFKSCNPPEFENQDKIHSRLIQLSFEFLRN